MKEQRAKKIGRKMEERDEEREYRGANDIEMDASYALVISALPPLGFFSLVVPGCHFVLHLGVPGVRLPC